MTCRKLSDRHWTEARKHLPARKLKPKGGRPPTDDRKCFEGIFWILWTGAQWSELPYRRNYLQRKKRGPKVGKTKRGKGSKLMVLVDGKGIPLGVHLNSASPAEVNLVDLTLETVRIARTARGLRRKMAGRSDGLNGDGSWSVPILGFRTFVVSS